MTRKTATKNKTGKTPATQRGIPLFRSLLLAMSLVAIISCVFIGFLTYYLRAQGIRQQQYRLLETLRDEKIKSFKGWFSEKINDVETLSRELDVVSYCEDASKKDSVSGLKKTFEAIRRTYLYDEVFLTDARGRALVTSANISTPRAVLPLRYNLMQQALTQKKLLFSDIFISRIHGDPAMFLVSPVVSPKNNAVIGVFGILVNPARWIYPHITASEYLGKTGEILLVNSRRVVQSPLKYQPDAIASLVIGAKPARRGALGRSGRIAADDYRSVPVMAAYGYIPEVKWGIVVKQDMAEINAPVWAMARSVLATSLGVLILALLLGFFIARAIAQSTRAIAGTTSRIGGGNLSLRVPEVGPREIRLIAINMNKMVAALAEQMTITKAVSRITTIAAKHSKTSKLVREVLPAIMEATASQTGVVYLAGSDPNVLEQKAVHGVDPKAMEKWITLDPPDHLLTQSCKGGEIKVYNHIPEDTRFVINSATGKTYPRAMLSIPLLLRGKVLGVIGLSSLYDYQAQSLSIIEGLQGNLAQAMELCQTFELTEAMGEDLQDKNQELNATNEELQSITEELQSTSEEQKLLLVRLSEKQQQASEADRMKSEFLSNMSHELRTPLNSVLSLSQMMLTDERGTTPEERREYLEIIERNGHHLLRLINDILDLSKIESGRLELFISSFHPQEPVNAALMAIRPLATSRGLAINVEIAETGEMQSDVQKLQQILLNLLANAQKFTDKGSIGISVRQEGNLVLFTVRDSGCGIPESALPHIFDEFRQVDGSTTRRHGGTGLGLAICRRLAALLGGTISVQSTPGLGSAFTLTIPMIHADASVNPAREEKPCEPQLPEGFTGKPRILIIEDNAVAALQLTTVLTGNGFEPITATDGEEALRSIEQNIPHGIILDLMIPKIDGFQVLNRIRSTPKTAHLPVLVLTAKDITRAEFAELTSNNICQLIQKGQINREQLLASIRRMIGIETATTVDKTSPVAVAPVPRTAVTSPHPTVMIVEDNPDNLAVTRAILHDMDITITVARDGKSAVEMAQRERPQIILMDINLPVMSGLEATQRIRQDPQLQDTVIIALTARAMMGDREAILAVGCDDYLSKPVEPGTLRATLARWTGGES